MSHRPICRGCGANRASGQPHAGMNAVDPARREQHRRGGACGWFEIDPDYAADVAAEASLSNVPRREP